MGTELIRVEKLLVDFPSENDEFIWHLYLDLCKRSRIEPILLYDLCKLKYGIDVQTTSWPIRFTGEEKDFRYLNYLDYSLLHVQYLSICHTSLEKISLPKIDSLVELLIWDNPNLKELSINLPNVRTVRIEGSHRLELLKAECRQCTFIQLDRHSFETDLVLHGYVKVFRGGIQVNTQFESLAIPLSSNTISTNRSIARQRGILIGITLIMFCFFAGHLVWSLYMIIFE